ncbi:MAG: response regulator, partial [Bacteroidetes bacterium]|nr:response regulator [Bacteroidota bacterium]
MPNNPIKSILIDDEPLALEVLKSHLVNFQRIEIVNTFSNAGDAMNWLESNQVDVVFTDIQMPGITGLELVKNQYPAPHAVIFTTAHTN